MKYKIVESTKAKNELIELVQFYEKIQPNLGDRILNEYEMILDTLEVTPYHYFNVSNSIIRMLFKKFQCGVFYKITNDVVEIVSIKDLRINPTKLPK